MDKKAMYKLSYGLFVVTVKEAEKDNGCITNTRQTGFPLPSTRKITHME